MARKLNEYAAYRGEDFITVGTAAELAQEFGVKVDTIRFMSRPAYRKRNKGKRIEVYKLEEDE